MIKSRMTSSNNCPSAETKTESSQHLSAFDSASDAIKESVMKIADVLKNSGSIFTADEVTSAVHSLSTDELQNLTFLRLLTAVGRRSSTPALDKRPISPTQTPADILATPLTASPVLRTDISAIISDLLSAGTRYSFVELMDAACDMTAEEIKGLTGHKLLLKTCRRQEAQHRQQNPLRCTSTLVYPPSDTKFGALGDAAESCAIPPTPPAAPVSAAMPPPQVAPRQCSPRPPIIATAGFTPLHMAVSCDRIENIKAILRVSPNMAAVVDIDKNSGQCCFLFLCVVAT
jgi:hypothetical protein